MAASPPRSGATGLERHETHAPLALRGRRPGDGMTARLRASFIGIGAQKCATTWLHGVLQQCPDVWISGEKELDFFSHHFDRGYEWYDRQLTTAPPRRHRGEISPSYFIHPDAARRAAGYNPALHILVTLRDPVERAFSNHLHEARKGHITGGNLIFETALANNPLYRAQGCYATHLARWLDCFPAAQVTVLFQEDIAADRAAMARRVTDALHLPPLADFLDLRANESVRYRQERLGQALWRVGESARRYGFGHLVELAKAAPGVRQLRAANREDLRAVVPPMTADTEQALTAYYADEVARLQRLLGRPVPWPRYHSSAT
jgi:hypothetical protein